QLAREGYVMRTNRGSVHHRMKIAAPIANAKAVLVVRDEFGGLDPYLWGFVDGRPIQNKWRTLADLPAETPASKAMSKDLKKRGFRFVGPTICYAFMQPVGMVTDHCTGSFRYAKVARAGTR